MKRLLSLSVLLLILSTVHCGDIFEGIRNCRTIRCYNTCHRLGVGSVTLGSWSRKVCGHSCGTVQRYTRAECTASKQIPSNQAMCTASTFRHGSGSATARTITATLTGKPDCRSGSDPSVWMKPVAVKEICCFKNGNQYFYAPPFVCARGKWI